ncbi:MAG TPA: DUF2071 domain-containing protein [Pirellulales bacterium]|jgi:hypothetical protein|nr:DUF2071 domain-containing protein [Pirellulales bacterium]
MQIPILRGCIDRRILINFRVDPQVLARRLPAPFRPQQVGGCGIAGICLIRLKQVRPRHLPAWLGISSENAAHRIAVEWDRAGQPQHGVFVPRRDTSSRLNTLVGGRLFPGVHHHAAFQVQEQNGRYHIAIDSDDRETRLQIEGRAASDLAQDSVFKSLEAASSFFEGGSLGYSTSRRPGQFDGLELRSFNWRVEPLAVERVESSYFDNREFFPAGSVEFDSALLMHGVEHEWRGRGCLCQ